MSKKKILTLDISELSPMMQDKLVEKMDDFLRDEAARIAIDLHDYNIKGKTGEEMKSWADAATTLAYNIRCQVRDLKENK